MPPAFILSQDELSMRFLVALLIAFLVVDKADSELSFIYIELSFVDKADGNNTISFSGGFFVAVKPLVEEFIVLSPSTGSARYSSSKVKHQLRLRLDITLSANI
jgi:hypothetical protein